MSNLSVMSFLEQANRAEPSIDFSDLPSYEEYMDGAGLMPIPSPLAPLLPLGSSLSTSFTSSSSSPAPPQGENNNKMDGDEKENNLELAANSETEKQAEVPITHEQEQVSSEEKVSEEGGNGVDGEQQQPNEGDSAEASYCGFDEAVEIKVVARNEDRIILALSDGISQREVIFCPSSALVAHGAGSTGIGMWLLGGLVSLVPPTQIEAMRDRLLMFDGVIKAQYSAIIEHFVSQRRGIEKRVKSKIESRIEGWLEQKGRILLKQSLLGKEGEMPAVVQKTVSEVVDFVWPDVKIELWALYDSVMGHDDDSQWDLVSAALSPIPSTSTTTNTSTTTTTTSTPTTTFESACAFVKNPILILSTMFHSFRCFFLFTLSPFNQSFGRKIKNVWWWIFKLIRILPFYSMSSLSFLLTLLLIDRTDEFQLISFILEFKGTQFIGVGMISTLSGALRYISCVNFPSVTALQSNDRASFTHSCDVSGPGSNNSFYLDFVAFVLQIILVWVAFFHLPYTKKRYKADDHSFVAAVRDEFEGEDEWQVVDTEEKWALVGKGGSLLREGGLREEEEEEELLEEEESDDEEGSGEQKTEREGLEVEPVIIDLLDPLFVSDTNTQNSSADPLLENNLAPSCDTTAIAASTISPLHNSSPASSPTPFAVTVTPADSTPLAQDEQKATPETMQEGTPAATSTALPDAMQQEHVGAEVSQEIEQPQSDENMVTPSEDQTQHMAAPEEPVTQTGDEVNPNQVSSVDNENNSQAPSSSEATPPHIILPAMLASANTEGVNQYLPASDEEDKANKSHTSPVLRKRGKKTRNNSGNSPKKSLLDSPCEGKSHLREDNNDLSEGELRRSQSGSGSDSDNNSDKAAPRLTAASTIWGLAYTSCAVFVSSAVNWTPSDTNRQQLRSFRSYLERLGTQRERGRLLYMLKYDLIVFCLLSTLFLASTLRRVWIFWDVPLADWEWQIRADMYWLKTLYGLLSAPFVVFVLPIFAQVLLHLRPTGYTSDGRCVPQQRRGTPAPPPQP